MRLVIFIAIAILFQADFTFSAGGTTTTTATTTATATTTTTATATTSITGTATTTTTGTDTTTTTPTTPAATNSTNSTTTTTTPLPTTTTVAPTTLPGPILDSVSPAAGASGVSAVLTIFGAYFNASTTDGCTIFVGGSQCSSTTVISDTVATCDGTAQTTGSGFAVKILTATGNASWNQTFAFYPSSSLVTMLLTEDISAWDDPQRASDFRAAMADFLALESADQIYILQTRGGSVFVDFYIIDSASQHNVARTKTSDLRDAAGDGRLLAKFPVASLSIGGAPVDIFATAPTDDKLAGWKIALIAIGCSIFALIIIIVPFVLFQRRKTLAQAKNRAVQQQEQQQLEQNSTQVMVSNAMVARDQNYKVTAAMQV